MTIELRDGRTITTRVDHHRGAPQRPLTRDELVQKYHDCATMVLDSARAEQAREMIENLEQVSDIAQLVELLTLR